MATDDHAPEWRTIPDFPDYEVSSLGGFRRSTICRSGKYAYRPVPYELKTYEQHGGGYRYYTIKRNGRQTKIRIRHAVLEAFGIPKPFPTAQVAHLDGNPNNDRLDNLAWKTAYENSQDKFRHGTVTFGEDHPGSKVTVADVIRIRELFATGSYTFAALGRQFGLDGTMIGHIVRRRFWTRV